MTTVAETIHQSRRLMKSVFAPSRNIALGSIFGVIGGTLLMFRFLAPQRDKIVSNEEVATYRGGDSDQTDQGETYGQTARSPRK
ncbi:hypothetical protein N7491_008389 [Penicillium cf. griseofulvum]|uniref:Uncharacterized protein n=1 Tax=Penicillium cf. griseofulvum TaxID=2972120 RepID=A0A9W9MGC3_9EURO|nr:hypothetical protein N7472_006009 [Penicillium cf. griseofulvum]KAJ5423173.1 hypothetical protein N7491_008389 [Penicillium cf. griseofulvum]KAJ5431560.1 hypothetical protein N7445_009292 [Penicillium cf. griseofulvum]